MISSDINDQLRRAGLRVTAPRRSVLEWLGGHPHATVEQVRSGVAQALGSVSTQTVYDNHHHVVCRCCGRTEDVDCANDPLMTWQEPSHPLHEEAWW